MTLNRWGWAVVIAAGLSIAAAPWALGWAWLAWVFKPAATLAVIAHAASRGHGQPARRWVLLGLWLSLAGDVALLWPRDGFVIGLASFLLAHLAYLVAFTRVAPLASRLSPFAAYAAVASAVLLLVWPGVPSPLRPPVAAYVFALICMAAQAAVVWLKAAPGRERRIGAGLALGGALFVASDSLLAINRFAVPLPAESLLILATYWAAQWRIASWLAPRQA